MKRLLFIYTLFFLAASSSAQENKYSKSVIDLNNRAMELYLHNLSDKDSIAKVLDLLDQAIALDSAYVMAYGNKANLLMSYDRYDEALKTLDEAIANIPGDHGFYLLKGLLLEKLGRAEEANPVYKKGLELCESKMKQRPAVGLFIDSLFLKYCAYGIDTPASEVKSSIPASFTEEEKKTVAGFMDMIGSFKHYKEEYMKDKNMEKNG